MVINKWLKVRYLNTDYYVYCTDINDKGIQGYFMRISDNLDLFMMDNKQKGFFLFQDITLIEVV